MRAQFRRVGQLDHFVERIFNDGVGKTGRNILNRGAFFLCLLHIRIHENRTAGAEIDRIWSKKRFPGESLSAVSERVGKVLQKGTAARTAGFIQKDTVNGTVFQTDALHVLPISRTQSTIGSKKEAAVQCATVSTSPSSREKAVFRRDSP